MTNTSSEPRRVLIADDDEQVLALLVELLEQEGYEVFSAADGGTALELALVHDLDVVVSDVVMPVLGGIELCRRLKESLTTANVPVLLISGLRSSSDHGLEGLHAGADDYLDVPFRNEAFLVKVARLAERHRIERHYREIVEQAADIIYTRTIDGYLTSINASGCKFFGRSAKELVGLHLSELIGSEAAAKDTDEVRNFPLETPVRSLHCLKDSEGQLRYLEGMITVERGYRGEAATVRGVVRDVTEQKLAAEALRESEERYRQLVECSPDAIIVISDGKFVYVNSAARTLYNASCAEDLIGKSILEVVHPDYRSIVSERLNNIQEQGQPNILNVQKHVRLDGKAIDVEVTGIPFTLSGKPAVQAVIRDITERTQAREALKQTEKASRENEERYRELVENANDIIYTHDLAGNFTSLNRSGERIVGYSWEEASQMNISDVIAPEYLSLARQMLSQKTTGKAPTIYEIELITKYDRRIRIEVSSRVIYEEGKPVGVQGVARDLTEHKRSQEALRESQSFFNSFMDNSPSIAFMKDEAGRYVYVNKPFEELFGVRLEFLRGKTSFDWLPRATAQHTHEHDLCVLSSGAPQEIVETVPTQDGTPHHWLVVKFPMTDASGRRFIAGVGVDITERRRVEKALTQQAEREAITHRISQAVRCSLETKEIFQSAVRELGSYLEVDRCSLYMKDEKAGHLENVAEYHADGVKPAATDFKLGDLKGLAEALSANGVLVFNDAPNDKRITKLYETILKQADVQSIMYVAIRVGDEVPAAFALSTTREVRYWSESDIALAKAIADQTGIAIRQAQLYQKSEATSTRESLVNRVSTALRASLSLPEVLSTATRELGQALAASRVHLHLYSPENPLSPAEHEYVAPGCTSVSDVQASSEDPIGRHLLETARPIVIADALNYENDDEEFSKCIRDQARQLGLRSQINYPVVVKGLFRGVLCIHQTDRVRYWSDDEEVLVEAVAVRLAIGIAQAELFEMVARGKQEWETTFDAMSDGIFIFDRAGQLKRVNRAGAAMEGAHPRTLLGKNCCDILRTSDEDEGCVVENAIAKRESVTIEITPVGLNRPLLVSVEPVADHDDKTMAVVCTARDLSELRKVQAVAREHQSLLTNILESARESIYAIDTDGRFKWCNTATQTGLGYKREEFIGRSLLEMVHENDRPLVAEKLAAALDGEAQTYEMRYHSPDGQLRYARVDNSPLVVDGHVTGVLGIARDITEQKEERERAARADKLRALGQLASGVAHDFNNSLAAILGRAQLLRRQLKDDALIRNLDIIQTAAEDAAATVRRIQTFARKAPAKEFDVIDVSSLLNDAVEITRTRWQNEAQLRGLEYEVTLDASAGQNTYGSASELREVFVNLIVNAVDAMPEGGKLAISSHRESDHLRLRFADTGTGMPEDVRQKIFEPFFSTKGAHGTGLGLSVSYSIIERHEGSISVVSELGRGAVFTIELSAHETELIDAVDSQDLGPSEAFKILVVDDEEAVRETLADMLEAMNHTVVLAENGQQAIQKLAGDSFDLVFTDLAMPEMDGWETAREIRKRWPDMNVVLVTGYGPGTTPPEGEADLVNAIIGKPFDFVQVSGAIAQVCRERPELENASA
jgi:PAS domain S-box-containing protein